jgi:hypothetical protein
MHPNGQIPTYEWNFSDVNPPVHAWATFRTFRIERKLYGRQDLDFLERVFQKLLLNFTWWVNRRDFGGKNVLRVASLALIISGSSIVRNHCPLVVFLNRPIVPGGWLSIAYACRILPWS